MFERSIFSSRYRFIVYIILTLLVAIIGNLGGWVMGVGFGLILSVMLDLYSSLRSQNEEAIEKNMHKYRAAVIDSLKTLDEFKILTNLAGALNTTADSEVMTDVSALLSGDVKNSLVPIYVLESLSMSKISKKPYFSILIQDRSDVGKVWPNSLDLVEKFCYATSYIHPSEWVYDPYNIVLQKQKKLVADGKLVRRVVIIDAGDSPDEAKRFCRNQRRQFHIECRYITLEEIKRSPLCDVWEEYWQDFLGNSANRKDTLLSPDFSIIDGKLIINFLLNEDRRLKAGSIFINADFIDRIVNYHELLFVASHRR
jgi:hypothetical protein